MKKRGYIITFLGGDKRELILGEALENEGFDVRYAGFEKAPRAAGLNRVKAAEAPAQSRALIAPLSGIDASGSLKAPYASPGLRLDEAFLASLRPTTLLLAGSLPRAAAETLREKGVFVLETAKREELVCANAVPTAEGALELALRESDVTLYDNTSLVTGFGRCAKALVLRLKALGSRVTVAARRESARAEAFLFGCRGVPLAGLAGKAGEFDFIFNTVPALLFNDEALEAVKPGAVLIDIASKPGGVDFKAARGKPFKTLHALGIPGKAAPVSAGRILARIYLPLILRHLEGKNLEEGGDNHEA